MPWHLWALTFLPMKWGRCLLCEIVWGSSACPLHFSTRCFKDTSCSWCPVLTSVSPCCLPAWIPFQKVFSDLVKGTILHLDTRFSFILYIESRAVLPRLRPIFLSHLFFSTCNDIVLVHTTAVSPLDHCSDIVTDFLALALWHLAVHPVCSNQDNAFKTNFIMPFSSLRLSSSFPLSLL